MDTVPGATAGDSLPFGVIRLRDLALNLWWSWHADAVDLFRRIDPAAWAATTHNPVALLQQVRRARLEELAADALYLAQYHRVLAAFDEYMAGTSRSWYARTFAGQNRLIAYFCAEFGLHESLPIYAGGLGVLAGDHCKTASDLGLPFVAVGLWYAQGYFRQSLTPDGGQIAGLETLDPRALPLQDAGPDGAELYVEVEMPERHVRARVWRLQVGRIPVYLLDPDVPGNSPEDRALCAHLYGGDREVRIAQEVLLGIGGVRALRALGLQPTTWHMNEGHAAFMGLERMREMVQGGMDFTEAWPAEAASTVFTTHTPVPAGNEVFRHDLVLQYLADMPRGLGLDAPGFLALANEEGAPGGTFAMTPLALRLSHRANGVSALHGAVARRMWAKQFPDRAPDRVPITSITNGVHTATWMAPALAALFDRYLGAGWLEKVDDPAVWEGIAQIPEAEIWQAHLALKEQFIEGARGRLRDAGMGEGAASLQAILNPSTLTIGFARRFATYKRATLLFHDTARAMKLLNDPDRPVQILFAGKAHPADGAGQGLIRQIVAMAREPEFAGKVVFLPGYDIALARLLVQGVDLWLNNPERPMEASGTSGQKAALNGVPNCSIRDGWWDEAFNGRNGWAFGGEVGNDDYDSASLYALLEEEILPAFYDRDVKGLPRRWLAVMRESIRTIAPAFSAQRMVKDYMQQMYK